jgi:hypothetical protein
VWRVWREQEQAHATHKSSGRKKKGACVGFSVSFSPSDSKIIMIQKIFKFEK